MRQRVVQCCGTSHSGERTQRAATCRPVVWASRQHKSQERGRADRRSTCDCVRVHVRVSCSLRVCAGGYQKRSPSSSVISRCNVARAEPSEASRRPPKRHNLPMYSGCARRSFNAQQWCGSTPFAAPRGIQPFCAVRRGLGRPELAERLLMTRFPVYYAASLHRKKTKQNAVYAASRRLQCHRKLVNGP
jgi:hypothetical protein